MEFLDLSYVTRQIWLSLLKRLELFFLFSGWGCIKYPAEALLISLDSIRIRMWLELETS